MRINAAKLALVELLTKLVPGHKVEVHYWQWEHQAGGVRISEIAFSKPVQIGVSGFSYMQYEDCGEILFAAERFVIDTLLGEDNGGLPDVHEEKLRALLTFEDPLEKLARV